MSRPTSTDTSRRDFLKRLGVAGTAAGAIAVTGQTQADSNDTPDLEHQPDSGYQETEHVRSFYDTLRK